MKLRVPYPPLANRYWRVFRGRVVKSEEARRYQQGLRMRALTQRIRPLSGDVVVSLAVFRPRRSGDLDGAHKVLLDALQGVAYVNDSQVVELLARRYDDPADPRVEVSVEPDSKVMRRPAERTLHRERR